MTVGRKLRPLAECYDLIEVRAIRLVRLHVAGREPMSSAAARRNREQRDKAFDRLVAAVEERDRAAMAHEERCVFRSKAAATRRRNGGSK
jgi:hypothetical protein